MSKQPLFREMLPRALHAGFRAKHVVADAWFGCKENMACCLDNHLIGIFQMKRGNLAYQYQGRDYTATQLYAKVERRLQPANPRARYKTASLVVSVNLQTEADQPDRWVKVRLVFSAPVRAHRADTWVVFLSTEPTLSETKLLEIYALRWSIEVYFKEIKQNLGFLKEQSGRYQLAYASVHLAAMRYLLLFEAMLRNGQLSYGEIRDRESGRLLTLTYATLLWQLFRALIEGALDGLIRDLGRKVIRKVMGAIDGTIEAFLNDALQIGPELVSAQLEAEELGYLGRKTDSIYRQNVSSFGLRDTGLQKLNEDIAVPRSRLEDFFVFAAKLQKRTGFPLACFGHAGDGNIHVNVMVDDRKPGSDEASRHVLDELFAKILSWGGVITGEHGIGLSRKPWWNGVEE